MAVKILKNGSSDDGRRPRPLAELFTALKTEPLHPVREITGGFITSRPEGGKRFHGHFWKVPYVFDVIGYSDADIVRLTIAIEKNLGSKAYAAARAAHLESEKGNNHAS